MSSVYVRWKEVVGGHLLELKIMELIHFEYSYLNPRIPKKESECLYLFRAKCLYDGLCDSGMSDFQPI